MDVFRKSFTLLISLLKIWNSDRNSWRDPQGLRWNSLCQQNLSERWDVIKILQEFLSETPYGNEILQEFFQNVHQNFSIVSE